MPFGGATDLAPILEELKIYIRDVQSFAPLRLAAVFGGLLTEPSLQSNCLRLEALIHLTLAIGNGRRRPTGKIVERLFSEAGKGELGRKEDPPEDVFVSLITTPRGNFRVLEGIWEAAGFELDRFVGALERLPGGELSDRLRESVYSLLKLSDLVCERAGLVRYQSGGKGQVKKLPASMLDNLEAWIERVVFSEADLQKHGISLERLAEFGFPPDQRSGLRSEEVGHSTLERFPVAFKDGIFYLLLPTAVSPAIRRFVVEAIEGAGLREIFVGFLALEYGALFGEVPLLGNRHGAPIEFRQIGDNFLAGVSMEIDPGLFVNVVFAIDNLKGFARRGLISEVPDLDQLSDHVGQWMHSAAKSARASQRYRAGITLFVLCAGRPALMFPVPQLPHAWEFEVISAADLHTLCWLNGFNEFSLWRLLKSEGRLKELGVSLQNVNGLLNLVGWSRSLEGHLIPHGEMPDEFGQGDATNMVLIEQNASLRVRRDVLEATDPHVAQDATGRWIKILKDGEPLFKEDSRQPFYCAYVERGEGGFPLLAYESSRRIWWCDLTILDPSQRTAGYERIKMLKTWLCRSVPVLERELPDLPAGPIVLKCHFSGGRVEWSADRDRLDFQGAKNAISAKLDRTNSTITLTVQSQFEDALYHPENIAERALVDVIINSVFLLGGCNPSLSRRDQLLQEIVPSPLARQTHAFQAANFRDRIRDKVWVAPIVVDDADDAFLRLGLGWLQRDRARGAEVFGKSECLSYLNPLVEYLEDEVCDALRSLDRRSVVSMALLNHESAAADRDNWRRTAAAVLALHEDQAATREVMVERESLNNGVFQASRILIEFAICECPLVGGRAMGKLDLSHLMAKILLIQRLGGWSDAIRWEVMEPRLRITPLGDIHANHSFYEDVIVPFARVASDLRVAEDIGSYAERFKESQPLATDTSPWPDEFWVAWADETGGTFDEVRKFLDILEDMALRCEAPFFVVKRSTLWKRIEDGNEISPEAAVRIVDALSFVTRPRWRDVPPEFDEKDRFPWRFRRRLSVLRRPLLQIDNGVDPLLVVAPGIARDAVVYMLGNYYRGDYPLWQLKPKMKSWTGRSRDRMGSVFARKVAERLTELGWETVVERKVTEILRAGFDRDYGDVDVLAWNAQSCRVLVCECKDLQYRKTEGEIAEQLMDYRGEINERGKRDDLRKHLDRLELLSRNLEQLRSFVGILGVPIVEGHLVFSNPVPMQFAWEQMRARTGLCIFADLDRL